MGQWIMYGSGFVRGERNNINCRKTNRNEINFFIKCYLFINKLLNFQLNVFKKLIEKVKF